MNSTLKKTIIEFSSLFYVEKSNYKKIKCQKLISSMDMDMDERIISSTVSSSTSMLDPVCNQNIKLVVASQKE